MKRLILLFISLLLFANCSLHDNTQDYTLYIEEGHFQVDHNHKIIVINQDFSSINQSFERIKLDSYYYFGDTLNQLKLNHKYSVYDSIFNNKYSLYISQLPLLSINTQESLQGKDRKSSLFSLSPSDGQIQQFENVGLAYRGNFSFYNYAKKSYRLEFWEDTEGKTTKSVQLFDFREDDDWILQAMFSEPLRLNDKVSNQLWSMIDTLYYIEKRPDAKNHIDFEYLDLFVNEEYKGVFALSDRIDRKQLRLKKFKNNTIKGELYKGKWNHSAAYFEEVPKIDNDTTAWGNFIYKYPQEEDTVNWNNLADFVDFVVNSSDNEFYPNYTQYIQLENAINYFLFVNLIEGEDNLGNNWYIARRDNDEPYFFVPWDLDATFGCDSGGDYKEDYKTIVSNGLFNRLILDCNEGGFLEKTKERWYFLRKEIITQDKILSLFYENYDFLENNGVYLREKERWGHIETPPNQVDYKQLNYLEKRIDNRIKFLDDFFELSCDEIKPFIDELVQIRIEKNKKRVAKQKK